MKSLLFLSLASITFAQPLAWPPGYFNARSATDPTKPQPKSEAKELQVTATHQSIGVEWNIDGDTDHDATCAVRYRLEGKEKWLEAMPLMRVDYAGWYDTQLAERPFNMLAGSVMFFVLNFLNEADIAQGKMAVEQGGGYVGGFGSKN